MFTEINQQMEEAQQGIFRENKINAMIGELSERKKSLKENVDKLKKVLEKENMDVEKLENQSLVHIFHSILGKLNEKIEKEQQEALAAKLKYDQSLNELEQVVYQIKKLREEMLDYRSCKMRYRDLYAKKKELLMASNSDTVNRILEITEQVSISQNNLREIEEAIKAGERVARHLDNAYQSLNSAEGWGTWDLLGGGLIADMAKHSHIDELKSEVERAQMQLLEFRTELADVKINYDIQFNTDGFGKFADFFFDGLIADWSMQSKIQDSLSSVNNVKGQVESVLSKLRVMKNAEEGHRKQIEGEMNGLIIMA